MSTHRLPYEEAYGDGKLIRRRHGSPNGILPTLLSFGGGRRGSWVAWSVTEPKRGEFETHTRVEPQVLELTCARVPLSKRKSTSSTSASPRKPSGRRCTPSEAGTLPRGRLEGPTQGQPPVRRAHRRSGGRRRNRLDSRLQPVDGAGLPARVPPRSGDRLLPSHLLPVRRRRSACRRRREIVGSLLQCDYVGFHIPRAGRELRRRGARRGFGQGARDENCAPPSEPMAARSGSRR